MGGAKGAVDDVQEAGARAVYNILPGPEKVECPECGELVSPGETECPECGAEL